MARSSKLRASASRFCRSRSRPRETPSAYAWRILGETETYRAIGEWEKTRKKQSLD
jgi:hypothetical protein